jgi:hypothetical protein
MLNYWSVLVWLCLPILWWSNCDLIYFILIVVKEKGLEYW